MLGAAPEVAEGVATGDTSIIRSMEDTLSGSDGIHGSYGRGPYLLLL